MRRYLVLLLMVAGVGIYLPTAVFAQGGFEVVTGKDFDKAMVTNFYLEGQAIPAQKRNAALVKSPIGARALFALLDTSGYGADITQKYNGMLITEGKLTIGGRTIEAGSYGFGFMSPTGTPSGSKQFSLYDQAGHRIFEVKAGRDEVSARPRPLQVIPRKGATARLCVGRDYLELK
jgi:hypothetical protein